MSKSAAPSDDGSVRRRLRRSRALRIALLALAALALAGFIGTRSFVLRRLVEPRLAAMLGCEATCRSASLSFTGDLVLRDVSLRAPGVAGSAGEFFQAPRAVVKIAWRDLVFGGSAPARSLTIDSPTFRVSVAADERVNIASVGDAASAAAASVMRPPAIEVRNGTIEFGESGPLGSFTRLADLRADGSLRPAAADGVYALSLKERTAGQPGAHGEALTIEGEIDLNNLEGRLSLRDLDLSRWGVEAAPSKARDLLRGLTIDGRVQEGQFAYTNADGLSARLRVENVNVGLPVPIETNDFVTSEPIATRLLRTRGVSGLIRIDSAGLFADLTGVVEDVPGRVILSTQGLELTAPLTCDISVSDYAMGETPGLLPFAPRHVRQTFESFSNPKGAVSGTIRLSRGEPVDGQAAPILASGRLDVRNGWAMRRSFPYPIENISGTIAFDNDKVELLGLRGVGPTGASVVASGVISPLGRWAGVDVRIDVESAAIDSALREALQNDSRRALDALFDAQALATLRRDGALDSAPEFALGGQGQVRIHVTRPPGPEESYETVVEAAFPRVGFIPSAFPHPLIAENLQLRVDSDHIALWSDRLRGLLGGEGVMRAVVVTRDESGPVFRPTIDMTVRQAPITELLLRALPPVGAAASTAVADDDEAPVWTAERIVRELGIAGAIDLALHIEPGEANRLAFAADVQFRGLRAAPTDRALPVTGLSGAMRITNAGLTMRGVRGEAGGSSVALDVDAAFPGHGKRERAISARVSVDDLPLDAPLEDWAALASASAGERARALRVDRRLAGKADVTVDIEQRGRQQAEARVAARNIRDAELDLFGGRLAAKQVAGTITAETGGVHFDDAQGAFTFSGAPFGDVQLNGRMSTAGLMAGEESPPLGALDIAIADGAIESPLVSAALTALAGKPTAEALSALSPSGRFDAHLRLGEGAKAEIRPKELAIHPRGVEIRFTDVAGAVSLDGDGARVTDAALTTPNWRIGFDGAVRDEAGGRALVGALDVEGTRLDDQLLALLPANLAAGLRAVSLGVNGSFRMAGARIAAPINEPRQSSLSGSLSFDGASAQIGTAIESARGVAEIRLDPNAKLDLATKRRESLRVGLSLERLTAAGVRMQAGAAEITRDDAGVISVRNATAQVHGGKASVEATLTPDSLESSPPGKGPATDQRMLFEANVRLQDVDLALALADWSGGADDVVQAPGSRGRLRGGVFVGGSLTDPATKFGRGELEIRGGEALRLPLLMPIIELSNLSAPKGESLEQARASFFIEGDTIRFERIEAESDSILVVGSGSAQWPDLSLDLRFNTRRKKRLGVLSDLLEGLRDEIVTATIRGSLREPKVGVEQLPATRRMLDDLFGGRDRNGRTGAASTANASNERGGAEHP